MKLYQCYVKNFWWNSKKKVAEVCEIQNEILSHMIQEGDTNNIDQL